MHLGYHGNGHHFEFLSTPPKAATHYGGYSYKEGEALRGKIDPTLY
jgi:hypothetical protein